MEKYVACKKRASQEKVYGTIALVTSVFLLFTIASVNLIIANAEEYDFSRSYQKKYATIIVERNETVWSIAEEMLSDGYGSIYELIEEIGFINQLDDDYKIKSGTALVVPYYEQS